MVQKTLAPIIFEFSMNFKMFDGCSSGWRGVNSGSRWYTGRVWWVNKGAGGRYAKCSFAGLLYNKLNAWFNIKLSVVN